MVIHITPLTQSLAQTYGEMLLALNDSEWENWSLENLLAERPSKWQLSLMVRVDENIAGYAIVSRTESEAVHLHHIVVGPIYRGRGIGHAMIRKISEMAIDLDIHYMTLKVHKTNVRAISLYQKMGFKIIAFDHPELYKMRANLEDMVQSSNPEGLEK